MILIDKIIEELQSTGGVSIYFSNILSRLKQHGVPHREIKIDKKRFLERYRECNDKSSIGIFHSSYYRTHKYIPPSKTITTVHDFTYEKFTTGPAKWVHSWQKNKAIRNSGIVICVSRNTAQDLMEHCRIDESKIRVIYNGVSDTYHPLSDIDVTQENPAVLFVGARSSYKNFTLAVKAVATICDLTLNIVGGGQLTQDELCLLERNLAGRYRWLGRLSDEELNIAYNQAYALLYPSSYEGFGIPVIEAMRAGCPVIAVNASSIPEVAGSAALLVNKPSVKTFTEALESIPYYRDILIDAGFIQASKFSWDRCFQETLSVYKELM